jgi:transposase-like protein
MIRQIITHQCPHCHSENIIRNGHNPKGKQQYRCKRCGRSGVLDPETRYTEKQREQILEAYRERPSLRGIERIFGVARETVAVWLKKSRNPATFVRHAPARSRRRPTRIR